MNLFSYRGTVVLCPIVIQATNMSSTSEARGQILVIALFQVRFGSLYNQAIPLIGGTAGEHVMKFRLLTFRERKILGSS